jgi:hypothetical protein
MFTKGQSGNPSGRKQGIPNKSTGKLRDVLSKVINNYLGSEDFQEDFNGLDPRDRIKFSIDLLNFVVPKLAAQTLDIGEEAKKNFASELTELQKAEELKRISPF